MSAHLWLVHLSCWQHGTSLKGIQACLISLLDNLTFDLSICNSIEGRFSFLMTGFRNIPLNQCHGVCWSNHLFCNLFSQLDFTSLFIVLFVMLLLFRTIVPRHHLCILGSFWITFTYGENCWYHYLFRCTTFFKEFSIDKIWLYLIECPNIIVDLSFSITIILETLMESWSYDPMLMKLWIA